MLLIFILSNLDPDFIIETERHYYDFYDIEMPSIIPDFIENSEGETELVIAIYVKNLDGTYTKYTT